MTVSRCPLAEQARSQPAGCAIFQEDRQLSFAELHEVVTTLAAFWRRRGVRSHDVVVVPPVSDWRDVGVLFSLWRVGAVVCPLSHRFPVAQREKLATMTGARWRLDAAAIGDAVDSAGRWSANETTECDPFLPATIVLTSGTSGTPKAVVHHLAAHFASARGAQANIPLAAGDRWLLSLPTSHVGGLAIVIRTILAGASLVIDPVRRGLTEQLVAFGITHVSVVATQLQRLLKDLSEAPEALRAILLGGGPYSQSHVAASLQRGFPLITTYGMTEMASQVTASVPGSSLGQLMTAGGVLPGRELAISPDGEILVRGESLCLGYLQQGSLVSVTDGDGWFHTGDVGWLDDEQRLHVSGRRDQMFISGGENIHPEEIELALMSLPGIRRAVVVPRRDAEFGFRPVAMVDAECFDPAAWCAALRCQLPGFKVPAAFRPWPAECSSDLKPSRARLRALIDAAGDVAGL